MTDNADFKDIVNPSPVSAIWKAEMEKLNNKLREEIDQQTSADIWKLFGSLKQCACAHTLAVHGEPPGPLTIASIKLAVKSLKEQNIVRKCQFCTCQEFEEDNLEWLMKRKKWAR